VVTASTVQNINLKVWDPLAYYPSTGAAFTNFTDTVSSASGNPNLCEKTYTAAITPSTLSTFSFDPSTQQFQILSESLS
jgi:hypothetical protein